MVTYRNRRQVKVLDLRAHSGLVAGDYSKTRREFPAVMFTFISFDGHKRRSNLGKKLFSVKLASLIFFPA